MRKLLFCEHCGKGINTETDIYFEADSDAEFMEVLENERN